MREHVLPFPDVLPEPLALALGDDPWSLSTAEREQLCDLLAAEQSAWLPRLQRMVEPPHPDDRFPAFLLELPPFAELRAAIGPARFRRELDTATADLLQRFVDRYRDYLRPV